MRSACVIIVLIASQAGWYAWAQTPVPTEGRPCAEIVDTFDDGAIDLRITYEYDEAGQLTTARHDAGDDGEIDRIDTYDYATDGRITEIRTDLGADGSIDQRIAYAYAVGPIGERRLIEESIDEDGDGRPEVVYTQRYDALGRPLWEERRAADGSVERIDFAYEDGELASEIVDLDGDGEAEQLIEYRRGEHGLRLVTEDRDGDGDAEWVFRYLYGPNNRLVTEEWLSDEVDTLTARTTFRYDTAGRLVEEVFDDLDDGDVDVRTTYLWGCWDVTYP